jgi:bifunctional NMN adenylyltransferase/nudix hydrolase
MQQALDVGQNLLVLCGSANQPRTVKNPWTVSEVEKMIRDSLSDDHNHRLMVLPLRDIGYNDQAWVEQVQETVARVAGDGTVGIIGHEKDDSSYYLKMFPQWSLIPVDNINDINATDIRTEFFGAMGDFTNFDTIVGEKLPEGIYDFLRAFALTDDYENLCREYEFLCNHTHMWAAAPYPPTFITTDAVVVQSGHVLLVRRRAEPGKGLFAIPGGYLEQNERIIDGTIRELREETKIKVPDPVLRGSIKTTKVYDDPSRSPRGRIVTHASLIELPPGELPKVKGSDDADKAKWIPLSVFARMEDQMFEDHFHIINDLLGR